MQIMQAGIVYSEVADILIKGVTQYVVLCQYGDNRNTWGTRLIGKNHNGQSRLKYSNQLKSNEFCAFGFCSAVSCRLRLSNINDDRHKMKNGARQNK